MYNVTRGLVNSTVMCKRKGEPLANIEFFEQLYADDDFCKQLGKAILSAGRLESELIIYIQNNHSNSKVSKANLGRLIGFAEKHDLLLNMVPVLKVINDQRNYLAHNIHALFTGLIEETLLPGNDLLDSDIDVFTDRAWQTTEGVNALADIVANYNENT